MDKSFGEIETTHLMSEGENFHQEAKSEEKDKDDNLCAQVLQLCQTYSDEDSTSLIYDESVPEPCCCARGGESTEISFEKPTHSFSEFIKKFNESENSEEKIHLALQFMKSSLSQERSPRFRDFWEAKRLCLPLFRENISSGARAHLWSEYVELSNEAKRLKEILDEQSAFAVEQIELALQALENDLKISDELLERLPPIEIPGECSALQNNLKFYASTQRELELLNNYASRINDLRKEVIKTEMRIRFKTKFLHRLSLMGDHIFPKRKQFIREISDIFIKDVDSFISVNFKQGNEDVPLYQLREEIKALQGIAKIFTLNTNAFTETRIRLSACWDEIKMKEKERKKEIAQKKYVFKQNAKQIADQIQLLRDKSEQGASPEDVFKESEDILKSMKSVELAREEVKILKDEIFSLQKPYQDRLREERHEKEKQIKEEERLKQEKIQKLKNDLADLLSHAEGLSIEQLTFQKENLLKESELLNIPKLEKQIIERQLKQVRDLITEKKEKSYLNLSQDDLEALEKLKAVLQQKKERRNEIKLQLKVYRKAESQSGFDIEKAMFYREQQDLEEERLEKMNLAISEIEEKIEELEKSD